jgi:hypothetical protein
LELASSLLAETGSLQAKPWLRTWSATIVAVAASSSAAAGTIAAASAAKVKNDARSPAMLLSRLLAFRIA